MCVLDLTVLLDSLPRAPEKPASGEQTLHTHWAPSMDAGCADAHFSAQPKPEAVCKAGGGVVEDTGTVHPLQEVLCLGLVACAGLGKESEWPLAPSREWHASGVRAPFEHPAWNEAGYVQVKDVALFTNQGCYTQLLYFLSPGGALCSCALCAQP